MERVLQFFKENEKLMESNSFDDFFESDEFNDLEDETKRDIFYVKTFDMSTQAYSVLDDCIEDFMKITSYIIENDYLQNAHECYETILKNYLDIIDDLLKPCFNDGDGEEEFINNFHTFVDYLKEKDIFYPNNEIKKNIINKLKDVQYSIDRYKSKIKDENEKKFKRYSDNLQEYITKHETSDEIVNSINNSIKASINKIDDNKEIKIGKSKNEINNIIDDNFELKGENNLKNSINAESSLNNDSLINKIDDFINQNKIIEEESSNKKVYTNNSIDDNNISNISNSINNDNNSIKVNNINNINISNNNMKESENQEFKIINNKSRIYDSKNSLNNSDLYYDSINMNFSISNFINEKVDNDNNEFEEEKVMEIIEEINEEIIQDIDKLAPMFNSDYNVKLENNSKNKNKIIINSFSSLNNINNNKNINVSNKSGKKKKKGKKKKNNNANSNN